ncbi:MULTISPECIES: TetR/AcrR family transcriptional regulator [unclassified Sphingomonas]|uniref:TetR/AcrR family transcriptional regulator n=1 Tax=unclassified Sphingomonas TaxID=196159 RepID=UPI00138F7EF9|nr:MULTISPECIES: TetR/AcrR family transcriptional regulator [unclassified Sphingomonas]
MPARPPQARGEMRRNAIMDAAESVFAERGYYGSSLREVSARSQAAIGLIAHHFPTKELLFRAVVQRKLARLNAIIEQSLVDAMATHGANGGTVGGQELIRAFIAPFLAACAQQDAEIRNYIRLTSHFMSAYTVPEVRPSLQSLQPISTLFTRRLREQMPDMAERDFVIGVYLIEAALIFMVQDKGFLEALSGGTLPMEQIDSLIGPAATFFDGGMTALARQR